MSHCGVHNEDDSCQIIKSHFPDCSIPEISLSRLLVDSLESHGKRVFMHDYLSDRSFTFEQVLFRSLHIGRAMRDIGLKTGDVICFYSPNSSEYVMTMLACFIAGGTVCNTKPDDTHRELLRQVSDCKPKFLVVDQENLELAKRIRNECDFISQIIVFGEDDEGECIPFASMQHNRNPKLAGPFRIPNPKEGTAMIVYTSGTTDTPKGVQFTHYNIVANIYQITSLPEDELFLSPEDIMSGHSPFSQNNGIMSLFLAIVFGCKYIIQPYFSFELFLASISKFHITCALCAPSSLMFLLKNSIAESFDVSSLKKIVCSGAPLSANIASKFMEKYGVSLFNAYGMTELTMLASFINLEKNNNKSDSIGFLMPNTEVRILDIESESCLGSEVNGEISIRGPQVAKGYVNNPQSALVFSDLHGWARTGDLGYYDADGVLYIVDRFKELIKYQGEQISPAEIESILNDHEAVYESCVIGIPDEESGEGELPKALIVLKPGYDQVTAEELKHYVENKTSSQKYLKGGIEFINNLPKLSNKISRKLVKELVFGKPEGEVDDEIEEHEVVDDGTEEENEEDNVKKENEIKTQVEIHEHDNDIHDEEEEQENQESIDKEVILNETKDETTDD